MQNSIRKNYFHKIFIVYFLLICPVAVLAPIGTWVPFMLSTALIIIFSKKLIEDLKPEGLNSIIVLILTWIILNSIFLGINLYIIEKIVTFSLLLISALIFNKAILDTPKFDRIIIIFSISFILSCFFMLLDFYFHLGLKLWLSKNLDFSNFKSLYQLKSWISLNEFRIQNHSMISNYLNSSYDRGITSLIILALPISTICYLYNYKFLAFTVFILSLILIIMYSTFAVKISYVLTMIFAVIFYFRYSLFKKYFLFFLALYFLLSPFILGIFDYKEFSNYEKNLLQNRINLAEKYCDKVDNLSVSGYLKFNYNNTLTLKCGYWSKDINDSLVFKNSDIFDLEKKFHKIIIFTKRKVNLIADQKLHRLIIWSYAKEKILEKPIFGHGFFSSRNIANTTLTTERGTNYQLIPLHVHNSILQIWLELGIVGLFLFFLFIKFLFTEIYNFVQFNHKISTVAIISFFLVFFIGQASYGLWQSWWLSLVIINTILYSIIFTKLKPIC